MLFDPTLVPDEHNTIFLMLTGTNQPSVKKLGRGFYLCEHWNFEMECAERLEEYNDAPARAVGCREVFGVCDSPEQFMARFGPGLEVRPECIVVSFCVVKREDQEASGGWRWRKWGPYIGDREPQHEYLYDEQEIDQVTTFHVYIVKESLEAKS